MRVEFAISTEDLDVIQEHFELFKKVFPKFEIVDAHFSIPDESLVEYADGEDMFTFKDVVFEVESFNHLWFIAKMVEHYQITNNFIM